MTLPGVPAYPATADSLHHHRIKTFDTWTYTQLEPGTYLWRSPYGYQYLRDRHGTEDLTPIPVDPPGG